MTNIADNPNQHEALIEIKNLSTHLHTGNEIIKAVDDVSLSINKGETFCLVGESGSGKSMLALSVIQLLPEKISSHPNGSILFNWRKQAMLGTDAETKATYEKVDMLTLQDEQLCDIRGSRIAMIFQEPMTSLNPVVSVGDQIMEALLLHNPEMSEDLIRSRAIKAMQEVKLKNAESRFDQFPHQLSGGQRQRIMIAMALACEPDLLIADEPTTALDVTVQAEVLKLMRELQQRKGMSILFITHDFGVVAQVADKVGVMKQGKLVELGETQQVLRQPSHAYSKKLIAAVPENLEKRDVRQTKTDTLISTTNLDVYFPIRKGIFKRVVDHVRAVDDVSIDIHQGKIVALVGESGSGKTTLGRAILQLQKPTRGSVKISGTELVGLSQKEMQPWRKKMQISFQDPQSSLNPRLLIAKTITEPMQVHGIGHSDEERIELAADVLESVQLKREFLWRYPHEFSGGQRQRIGLARALALNPEFIGCDEITSALDVSVQAEVLQLLLEIRKKRDLTLLFITHNIAVVEYLCDETIVMKAGKVVEQGLTSDVCGNPQNEYTQKLIASVPRLNIQ